MPTAKIMQLVVIALLPAALMGIYNHGLKALAVLVVSTGSAALAEWLYDHFMHKKNTVKMCIRDSIPRPAVSLMDKMEIPFRVPSS